MSPPCSALLRKIGLDRLLPRRPGAAGDAGAGADRGRLIEPASKLATARQLARRRRRTRWAPCSGWATVDEDELYRALDWLAERSRRSRRRWPGAISQDGTLVLYDVTSSYLEGRCCELARFGYSRDGKRDKLQIVFGLLCAADGCPVAVEVFEGDTADPDARSRPRSTSSSSASSSSTWCWSATAA